MCLKFSARFIQPAQIGPGDGQGQYPEPGVGLPLARTHCQVLTIPNHGPARVMLPLRSAPQLIPRRQETANSCTLCKGGTCGCVGECLEVT